MLNIIPYNSDIIINSQRYFYFVVGTFILGLFSIISTIFIKYFKCLPTDIFGSMQQCKKILKDNIYSSILLKALFIVIILIVFGLQFLPIKFQGKFTFIVCNRTFKAQRIGQLNISNQFKRIESCDDRLLGCLVPNNNQSEKVPVLINKRPSSKIPKFARKFGPNLILIRKNSKDRKFLRKFLDTNCQISKSYSLTLDLNYLFRHYLGKKQKMVQILTLALSNLAFMNLLLASN